MAKRITVLPTISGFSYLFLLLLATVASSEEVRIDDHSIVFLYESRAEVQAPDYRIAEAISLDYRNAKDEFTRYDLMERLKPVIGERIAEAREISSVYVVIGGRLGDYDFEQNAFPTGLGGRRSTFVEYGEYAATFANQNSLGFLPVPMESARALAEELRRNRRVTYTIYGSIVGARELSLNRRFRKALEINVTKIEATLDSGRKVGSSDF